MERKSSNKRNVMILLAIMTTSFAVMYSTIFQVINYNIFQAFPDQKMAVNFFISGPYVLVMLVSFISPFIYNRTNKKTSLVVACMVFTVSALLFTRQTTIGGFITVNLICGAMSAYINVSAVTLIAEIFVEESIKARYFGYYNGAMATVGSLFSVIAGYLAKSTWIGAFNTYWSAVLMTLLIVAFIPSMPSQHKEKSKKKHLKEEGVKNSISKLGIRFWMLTLNFVILGLTYFVPGFFLSLYIAEHALGDVTYAGIALSVDTLGGAIFAFFFGYTYRRFGSFTSVAAFVLMSAVLFLLYFFPHPVLLVMIVTFMGGSYMTSIAYAYQESSRIVPKECLSLSLGIIVGVQYISTFLAAYITTGLMALLNTDLLTPILIFPATWILVFALLEFISIRNDRKRRMEGV